MQKSHSLNQIQAIAFDLDGTLVDSAPGLALAVQLMLKELNLPTVTDEQVKNWVGNGVDVLVQRVFKQVNAPDELFTKARALFDKYYDQTIDEGTKLFPHVTETLRTLQENGYPLALVTNKPAQFLPSLLESLGIKSYFSLCLGGGDVIKLKPHPAPLYQVMATFGLYHDQLLFVGDSRNDISAAKNAHCPTVGLSYGYNYGESIASSEPDFLFDRFDEILSILPLPRAEPTK
ncbi:phosphoglycolate phosphatase [Zophobihabitans entericus]|uniref:Phosphoglycolate phosphatase n=1 Tax=Zophobihabitans entericus TaxID=1635327 RepID=A0A6G9I9U4_9GAMM|nr:phosphoglycolate phosphatase [Zophobihabitans entericus]QIQ20607.1 phosphoglycolate phosphatase [Zophobihabitans entericus]